MKYFLKFLVSIILVSNFFSLYAQHFYHIPEQRIKMTQDDDINDIYWSNNHKRNIEIHTSDMMISKFITLKEYKVFLFSIKENTVDSTYKKLVPNSCFFKEGNFEKYYYDPLYENYPVIGISWDEALEYCKWKTLEDNIGDSIRFLYIIPTDVEWYSAYKFLSSAEVENDFSKLLSDMTRTNFYESSYSFTLDLNPDYTYSNSDPPQFRRKIIMGKSFAFRNSSMESKGQQFYSYKDLPFCGFRIIKKKVYPLKHKKIRSDGKDTNYFFNSSIPEYPLLKKWGIENKIASNDSNEIFPTFIYHKGKTPRGEKYGELTGTEGGYQGSIKSTGCTKDGNPVGDWYFFNKNGLLKKQVSYDVDERVLDAEKSMQSYIIHDVPFIEKYKFIDDLLNSKKDNSTTVSDIDYAYETNNKRLNGYFIYSYDNFTVAGKYIDNMRFGRWCMWDEDENLILMREYQTDHKFKTIYPNYRNHELISLLKDNPYSLQRNKDGYYDYFTVKENAVVWSKSICRRLDIENNPILFKDFDFFDFLIENLKAGYCNVYEAYEGNEFYNLRTLKETLETFNLESEELIAYVIKEQLFFDIERFNLERRIIGICPVMKNRDTKKEREIFWIYLPDLRKEAAKINLKADYLPDHIKNLDDLFFFRYYGGKIIGDNNVYLINNRFSEYLTGKQIELEAQRLQKTIFDFEFNTWQLFNSDTQNP